MKIEWKIKILYEIQIPFLLPSMDKWMMVLGRTTREEKTWWWRTRNSNKEI